MGYKRILGGKEVYGQGIPAARDPREADWRFSPYSHKYSRSVVSGRE